MYQPKTIGKKDMSANGAFPVFGANGIMGRYHSFNHEKPQLVIGCRGACGTVHITEAKSWITGNSMVIQPDLNSADLQYLKYFFLGPADLETIISGAAQPQITQTALKPVKVPLPPLEEQKRIVAVLDQAFAALDRARANAEANLADAEELFDRSAAALHSEATSKAASLPLGELADFRNGLNYSRHSSGQEVKIAGVGDFQQNFFLPTDHLKSVKIDGELDEQDRLDCGDIIAVRSNGNKDLIGRVMLVPANDEVVSYSGFVIRIRLFDERLEPAFLCHYMKSEHAVAHLLAGGGGANISNLNQRILGSLAVPVISKELQRSLVAKLDELGLHVSHLRRTSLAKLEALEDLRQSILQKAFAGELT